MAISSNPLLEKLGYSAGDRLVIFHADDVGMCHGSNRAYLDLVQAGILKTGSVMMPCPWAPEIVREAARRPELDLGVHLTLTSEWEGYRWGPLSTRDRASGLLDRDGCFYTRTETARAHWDVTAARTELRAQLDAALAAGVDVTHLDTHMGAAITPELLDCYLALGLEYRLPVLMMRCIDEYTRPLSIGAADSGEWERLAAELEAQGLCLVDTFRITPGYHVHDREGGRAELYEEMLAALPPGITYFSLHPNAPGDIEAIVPEKAYWRTFEYEFFQSDRLRAFLAEQQIIPIGYRQIRDAMAAN